MGFMCVLLAAFDMLNAKADLGFSVHLSVWQTIAWLTVAGMLGDSVTTSRAWYRCDSPCLNE